MKTVVYTIALNEAKNVEGFMQSCRGADLILVGDTGSTDDTVSRVSAMGGYVVNVNIKPWRFDLARNVVLSLIPSDYQFCMALDLDERLPTDWRELVDANWKADSHRLRFRYVHNFNADGTPGTIGMKDFAHARDNYIWQHVVHEQLHYVGPGNENVVSVPSLAVEHRQDVQKSRDAYLTLMEQECSTATTTPRHVFWLLREYVKHKKWDKVIETANRFLDYPEQWAVERGAAARYMAKAMANSGKRADAVGMHYRAIQLSPQCRENWLDLAWYYHAGNQWPAAYGAVMQCLSIVQRPEHYLTTDEAWGYKVYELAAICAFKLELRNQATDFLRTAMKLSTAPHLREMAKRMDVDTDRD